MSAERAHGPRPGRLRRPIELNLTAAISAPRRQHRRGRAARAQGRVDRDIGCEVAQSSGRASGAMRQWMMTDPSGRMQTVTSGDGGAPCLASPAIPNVPGRMAVATATR
jgi:hypothetical protein